MSRPLQRADPIKKLYWSASISEIGNYLSWMFLTIFVYRETQSAFMTSLFFLSTRVPRILLAGAIGRWVDRYKNKFNTHLVSLALYTIGISPLVVIKNLQSPVLIIFFFSLLTIARTAVGISRTVTLKELCPNGQIRKATVILENLPLIMVGVAALIGLLLGSNISITRILLFDVIAQIISIVGVWNLFRPSDGNISKAATSLNELPKFNTGFVKREIEMARSILKQPFLFTLIGQIYVLILIFGSHPLLMSFYTGSRFKESAKAFSAYNFGGALGALLAVALYDKIKNFLDSHVIQSCLILIALVLQVLTLIPVFSLEYQNLIWIGVLSIFVDFSFLALFTNTKGRLVEFCHRDNLGKTLGFSLTGEYLIGISLTALYGGVAKLLMPYQLSILTSMIVGIIFALVAIYRTIRRRTPPKRKIHLFSLLFLLTITTTLVINCTKEKKLDKTLSHDLAYKVAYEENLQDLDPHTYVHYSKYILMRQIYETLVRIDQRFNLAPGLAEKWTIDKKKSQITFYLRDAHFSDGSLITPGDVRYIFLRGIRKNVFQFSGLNLFSKIRDGKVSIDKNFEILNERSFRISVSPGETEKFLRNLSLIYTAVFKVPLNSNPLLIGSGPFKVAKADFNSGIISLISNDDYDSKARRPHELIFVRTPFEKLNEAFNLGLIDEFGTGSYSLIKMDPPNSKRVVIFAPTTRFLAFNCFGKVFRIPSNRKEFVSLWPKNILSLPSYSDLVPATGLIPKGLPGHIDNPVFPHSISAFRVGPHSVIKKIVVGTANPIEYQTLLEYFAKETTYQSRDWKIEFRLFTSSIELIKAVKSGQIDARIFANAVKDYDSASLLATLGTGNSDNIYGVSDKTFDAMLEKAKRLKDEKREDLLRAADLRLLRQSYILPIGYSNDLKIVRSNCPDFVCVDSLQVWDRQYIARED